MFGPSEESLSVRSVSGLVFCLFAGKGRERMAESSIGIDRNRTIGMGRPE